MILSLEWLKEFTDIGNTGVKEFCDRMTDTGSKVECFEILGEDIVGVKVGRIVSVAKNENSDHLQDCLVDVGGDRNLSIVTGAQNIFEGAIVPVAVAPAILPGDVKIKAGKLRGTLSEGMLCSIGELGLTLHDMPDAIENGILILGEEFADSIGKDIREALMLSDTAVEFEITPNRPDCLSVIGLAREAAVSFDTPLKLHKPVVKGCGDGDSISSYLSVKDNAPDLCPRYTARVVKNVKIEPSPLWMRARLRASGVRPINNIVDITNYVMLEYGQPMHAFDYKCLTGSAITVRRAAEGEKFVSLDSKDHTLNADALVIADDVRAVALAGVMGGENSEITDTTATVVFESANFAGASVRVTAKKQGMRTDASARFEKGLDPENTIPAIERACELVELLGAGDVVEGMIDVYPGKTEPRTIAFNPEKINRFLGTDIDEAFMRKTLTDLEFRFDGSNVLVPSFRNDVEGSADLAEEVIRMKGYNTIESSAICASTTAGTRTPKQRFEMKAEQTLLGLGISEIQTFSFISPKYYDKIGMDSDDARRRSVVISNPLGEDTSVMRTTALPSMMEVVARNQNFNNENCRLYEMATVYLPNENPELLPEEPTSLTVSMYGNCTFYTLKGVIEALTGALGCKVTYSAVKDNPTFHPGRCAALIGPNGEKLGVFGEIHPTVAANYGFQTTVYAAEISVPALFAIAEGVIEYKPLPKYPAVTRDFSAVCDEELEVGSIEASIVAAVKSENKILEGIRIFDVYRGIQVGLGRKSVAFRVTFRADDHTLTQEESDAVSAAILEKLRADLGITLRQ
ncbi:MAG: phenylalanine--tRNA ligase subunit beta [Clostridia bacterium]|nr:phenylalanine--tRNA ligase subunit beta [Clostridia bacterium]